MQRLIFVSLAIVLPLAVVLFVTGVLVTNVRNPQDIVTREFGFNWIIRIIGAYVAVIAAVALLVLGITGSTNARMLTLVFPLLAGLLVFQVHWSTTIALAAICIATVAKEVVFSARMSQTEGDSRSPMK